MKIGITGIANGGKTVFLTSLLWHLTELEHSNFSYATKNLIENFKSHKKNNKINDAFPFDVYREKIAKLGQWPAKTKSNYTYLASLNRKDWKSINFNKLSRLKQLQFSKKQELAFFDFPGERIADAAIAAFPEFHDWSDHILKHFSTHIDYNDAIMPYICTIKTLCAKDMTHLNKIERKEKMISIHEELIYTYKLTLANLIHRFKPLISPSVFLLDVNASVAPMAPENELAQTRFSGLTQESQFIPLPAFARNQFPELAKQMAIHYKNYRKQLAWPLFNKIILSQRLIILIDIPSLLMGGVDRYNDSRQILHDLFEAIEPQSFLGVLFQRLQSFIGLGLEKIAFVGVKSDLVQPQDVTNGRLKNLLQEMTFRAKKILPDVECGFFICSAIHSTREGKSQNHLIGTPINNNCENKEMEFTVSPLPETWPENWEFGDYQFMEVAPHIPRNLMIPPKQFGIDQVFKFILTEKGSS